MIARSHTRSGEPVHFGNDPARMPGPENTYQSYGTAWANLSNTPFRLYKHWIHEGGISTPLIVHWPQRHRARRARSATRRATCPTSWRRSSTSTGIDLSGAVRTAAPIEPLEGHVARAGVRSATGVERPPMFWEHEGNAAVRIGKWKLVRKLPRRRGSSTTWTPTAPSCTTSPRSIPSACAEMAAQYEAWAQALRRDRRATRSSR